jgi:hypothetical protein
MLLLTELWWTERKVLGSAAAALTMGGEGGRRAIQISDPWKIDISDNLNSLFNTSYMTVLIDNVERKGLEAFSILILCQHLRC